MRTMLRLVALALLIVTAGCAHDPTAVTASSIAGTYHATTMQGSPAFDFLGAGGSFNLTLVAQGQTVTATLSSNVLGFVSSRSAWGTYTLDTVAGHIVRFAWAGSPIMPDIRWAATNRQLSYTGDAWQPTQVLGVGGNAGVWTIVLTKS
jgi:hypothetical protein